MEPKVLIAFIGLVILVYTHSSEGIRCFECTVGASGCNDPIDRNQISSIDCGDVSCMKTKATAGSSQAVTRGCAGSKHGSDGCNEGEVLGVKSLQCFCNTDECNAAVVSKLSTASLMAVGVAIFLHRVIF